MTYKDLWNNTRAVLKQSKQNQAAFQQFITIVSGRIQVEENYACELGNLSDKLDTYLQNNKETNAITIILSAFKSDVSRRASQTATFANHLKTDVLILLDQIHKRQVPDAIQAAAEIEIGEIQYQEEAAKLKDAIIQLKVLNKLRSEEFIGLQISKAKFFINKGQQDKHTQKVRKIQRQYKQAEQNAKNIIKQYNDSVTKLYNNLNKSLQIFQQQQVEKSNALLDNMKRILVFEVSMTRNFQYDIANISNHLEKIKIQTQVSNFIKKNIKKNVQKHSFQSLPKMLLIDYVLLGMIKKTFDQKIKFDKSEAIKTLINALVKDQVNQVNIEQKDYRAILTIIKQAKDKGIEQQHENQLNKLLQKVQNRNFFQIMIRELALKQDLNLVSIIQYFIYQCLKHKDIFCIRSMIRLIISQTNTKSIKNKDNILYSRLAHLPIWKESQFWQANIFEGIQQQLKINHAIKGEGKVQSKLRQKNIILKQLNSLCFSMILFGHTLQKTKQIAFKYCLFYGLPQKQYMSISKNIDQGYCIYNQAWGPQQKVSKPTEAFSKQLLTTKK